MKIYTNDLVKGHSDVKVKCLTFGLYTQVSDSGPLGPLVLLCPHDISQGALRFPPVCPSSCLSIRHTLQYRVCVINSSHSFQWTFFKPCILVVDIMKMCMWSFGIEEMNNIVIASWPFKLNQFGQRSYLY